MNLRIAKLLLLTCGLLSVNSVGFAADDNKVPQPEAARAEDKPEEGADKKSNNFGKLAATSWESQAAKVGDVELPKGALKLDFFKDGRLVYVAGPQVMTGKWILGEKDVVVFNMDEPLAGRREHTQTLIITGDELLLRDTDGTSLKFDRKKQDAKP